MLKKAAACMDKYVVKNMLKTFSLCVSTETPPKDGEEAASSSDSAADPAASLFNHWGRDLGPESRRVALKKFRYFGYNGYLSDRISLTRPIPDLRPDGSVHLKLCCYSDSEASESLFSFSSDAETCLIRQTFLSSV